MNITRDNFNEYAKAALELVAEDMYDEATAVSSQLIEYWTKETDPDEDCSDLDVSIAMRVLTYSQWRLAKDADSYALLAEILRNNEYWKDEFIESNRTTTGAWILQQKALAYEKLARCWAKGQLQNAYFDYAESYMERAIEFITEDLKTNKDPISKEMLIDCKIDLANIQTGTSNKLARMTAIPLFGECLSESQKEKLVGIYNSTTDALFENYYNIKGISIINDSSLQEEVKDDIMEYLLNVYLPSENDDLLWWMFTNMEAPEDRKKIRFVANIEDAADNDFEEIPWVFTLDRYPFDLKFLPGEKPTTDSIYEIDKENTNLYHRIR